MAAFKPGPQTASGSSGIMQDEFIVRIPKDTRRKFTLMKFGSGTSVDFAKLGDQPVKIERENNLKEYKTANDIDLVPKFGAGSEYGRDLKEESRRKKYGIMLKRYNPNDQPWNLKIGAGKQSKRYKGLREGTIAENTSYYIFTKAADGAFEAFPVEEWYNFNSVIKYKYLNSEEAEEEYSRRDKTLNLFNIMMKKRMKKEEEVSDDEDGKAGKKEGKKSKKKKEKDLILTDMDDWDDMKMSDDDDDDDDDSNDEGKDKDEGGAAKKKPKKPVNKAVKNSKKNSDDEAVEESDDGDYDDKEVDYMSDSGSSSSLSGLEEGEKGKKYDEKGVDEEAGLRNILDSEAEDDEEEEGEKEENEDEVDEKDDKKEEKKKDDYDSSSSSLEDDSDIEKDGRLATALFLQKDKKEKKERKDEPVSESSQKPENRTPTPDRVKDKGLKRKAEKTPDGKSDVAKKHKGEDSEGITEDAIRRYLMRKPMTTKDLLQKFKSKKLNMSNEKITHVIAQLLKKINPDKMMIHKKLYLSLKKPE